jgi:hypothetical protein
MTFLLKAVVISLVFFLIVFVSVSMIGLAFCLFEGVPIKEPMLRLIAEKSLKSGLACGIPTFLVVCLGYLGRRKR